MDGLQRRNFLNSRLQASSLATTATSADTLHQAIAPNAPPLPLFSAGDVINGRYEVMRILGQGGMGVVYQVQDRMFRLRPTALKTMRRVRQGEWLELFRAEFMALSELNHPNVASVYEFAPLSGETGHFFTMEFVQGRSLTHAHVGARPEQIWHSILQMGEALAYLHSRDILHLDVKPDNAVLTIDEVCKLLDFGLVGLAQQPGNVAGTLAYMDPQLLHLRQPSVLSDLYCLGISGLELLVGHRPHADTPGPAEVLAAKRDGQFAFTTKQMAHVPPWMRDCLLKLCDRTPADRYGSATAFLEAAELAQGVEHRPAALSRSAFVGRQQERSRIHEFTRRRLTGRDGPLVCALSAPSGMGKSRLVAGIRHQLQADGHVFLQGDAYDHDVNAFTALTPILLASAQLAAAVGRADIVDAFKPELVKMTPEFGPLYSAAPSLPYSHGEAEQERISRAAREYLLAVSVVTPIVMYLNDLQWAGQGTINALKSIIDSLSVDASSRLALLVSFRSDQISGRPVEEWLSSLPPSQVDHLVLAPFDAEQVRAMMSSMTRMPVSEQAATRMRQATRGVPLFIDETMRRMVSEGALRVDGPEMANQLLDWQADIDVDIVVRASRQSTLGQNILKLLAVSARPMALAHLSAAAARAERDVIQELSHLEQQQLVTPVPSDCAMYSVGHDRIRESLFNSLESSDLLSMHGRLGLAFLRDSEARRRDDLAVLAAVHLNETPLPHSQTGRLERCDLNLDAARSARNEGNFNQVLVFLDAAEAALAPDRWRHHDQAMRLTLQRATTLRAMLQFSGCIAECDLGIAHAQDLVEEGRLSVPKMESLSHLRRHAEVLDTHVSFWNRANPDFKLPRNPGKFAALTAAVRTRRLVRKHGVGHLLRPMNAAAHPLPTEAIRVTESAVSSAFVAAPNLFIFEVLCLARLAARHGSLQQSALTGPAAMSTILGVLRDFETAARLGRSMNTLLENLPDEHRGRARFYWAAWPANLSVPLGQLVEPMALSALECGRARDSTQEANAQWGSLIIDFVLARQPLSVAARDVRRVLDQWQTAQQPEAAHHIQQLQHTLALLGSESANDTVVPVTSSTTTRAFATGFQMATMAMGVGATSSQRRGFGLRDIALLNEGIPGSFAERTFLFFAAIANCAALRTRIHPWRRLELSLVNRYLLRTLQRFAVLNPIDFAHRVALLEAERLRTQGKSDKADSFYQQAAERAAEAGFRSELALILEKHAESLLALGRDHDARATAGASVALYSAWEAVAKVNQLKARFP